MKTSSTFSSSARPLVCGTRHLLAVRARTELSYSCEQRCDDGPVDRSFGTWWLPNAPIPTGAGKRFPTRKLFRYEVSAVQMTCGTGHAEPKSSAWRLIIDVDQQPVKIGLARWYSRSVNVRSHFASTRRFTV